MADDTKTLERSQTAAPAPDAPKAASPAAAAHDPFAAFRSEMDRLVDSFFGPQRRAGLLSRFDAPNFFGPAFAGAFSGALSPSVDLHDEPAAVTVTAELPGLKPEDVELSVRGGVLTLRGEKKQEETKGEGARRLTERRWGSFERSFVLPEGVDEEKAEAKFADGVLTVTLPKKPEAAAQPRKIAIS